MRMGRGITRVLVAGLVVTVGLTGLVMANGGPFVLKYPNGDPSAKGVLTRLDPDLKPGRLKELKVVKEDLTIDFGLQRYVPEGQTSPPLVTVSAAYTIENPTDKAIEVDFGFPVLRGIYISPYSMMPRPSASVTVTREGAKTQHVRPTIISNSAIYGIIRRRARATIDTAVKADARLAQLVAALRPAGSAKQQVVRKAPDPRGALSAYLTGTLKWSPRDAALMIEYASLDFGKPRSYPIDRAHSWWGSSKEMRALLTENLGLLSAIGEQKATQFFAQLATQFDPKAAAAYEAIFKAWGGDVREHAVDMKTGKLRPREIVVDPGALKQAPFGTVDPTIYARVDYLDPKAKITDAEKAGCRAVLKNLPVVFTFAPMNLLHYRVTFPASSKQVLTVRYQQYAFKDTVTPASYQLAYVVHPASMWDNFGPIHLKVAVPARVAMRSTVPCKKTGTEERKLPRNRKVTYEIYEAISNEKTGELLVAIDANTWNQATGPVAAKGAPTRKQ